MARDVPIIAAAEKRRQEEAMSRRLREQLGDDWEFKVVRSSNFAFGSPRRLRQMLEEEALAGWEMAVKMDDNRVYLKRPRSASDQD